MFLNLKYRIKYIRRFVQSAKILGLPINYKLLKIGFDGANPRIFVDSSGEYYFNKLIANYLDRLQKKYSKNCKEINLKDYDLKVLAANYRILSLVGLPILKYPLHISYDSKRRLNEHLYLLKSMSFDK